MSGAIGIDIGGTRIKGVVLDSTRRVLHEVVCPTEDTPDGHWKHRVKEIVDELCDCRNLINPVVGISAPGLVNEHNTAIAVMPSRLHGLEGLVWTNFLSRETWVLNDAMAALAAEVELGVATEKKHVLMLTLGTGVGGGILIDGVIYQGAFQKAGSVGHVSVDHEGEIGITGTPGTLEEAIGETSILRRSLGKFSSTKELLERYAEGDYFAQWVWLSSLRKLAIGIVSLHNVLAPECVVLGGGITEADHLLFDPLHTFIDLYEWKVVNTKIKVLKAQLGEMAGAVGAACFALKQTKTSYKWD